MILEPQGRVPVPRFIFLYLLNLLNLKLLTEIRRKTYKNSDQGLDRDTQERNWKKLEEIRIKTYKSQRFLYAFLAQLNYTSYKAQPNTRSPIILSCANFFEYFFASEASKLERAYLDVEMDSDVNETAFSCISRLQMFKWIPWLLVVTVTTVTM